MSLNKVNYLLLPLLVSILLSTLSNLKVGRLVDSSFNTVLIPVSLPTLAVRGFLTRQFGLILDLPAIEKEDRALRLQNTNLISQNENLKDTISDQDVLEKATHPYLSSVPIRIISIGKVITATTTLDLSTVKPDQPVVSGTSLIGFVQSVAPPIVHISALDSDSAPKFQVKTYLGQTGSFVFSSGEPQITDIPSENPINLNDTVLTQPTQYMPANLVVGKIVRLLSGAQEPLQRAQIKLNLTFSDNPPNLVIITHP